MDISDMDNEILFENEDIVTDLNLFQEDDFVADQAMFIGDDYVVESDAVEHQEIIADHDVIQKDYSVDESATVASHELLQDDVFGHQDDSDYFEGGIFQDDALQENALEHLQNQASENTVG